MPRTASNHRRVKRTSTACDLCRGRKLGCDNAKPKCENCQVRDVDCTYTQRAKQDRPSNARIQKLEEENARLRELLRLQASGLHHEQSSDPRSRHSVFDSLPITSSEDAVTDMTRMSEQSPRGLVTLSESSPSSSRPKPSSPFHGPSSVPVELECSTDMSDGTIDVRDTRVKNHLLAETTRQRQLETYNLKEGKLNFGATDPELGMALLSNYWGRQYYAGSAVYRPVFMRDMTCKGPYFSELLLNAMLFAGSKFTVQLPGRTSPEYLGSIGRCFRRRFEELLHDPCSETLFKSDLTTIQALLVVADSLFSWCDEGSLSWHYLGLAISMIVDLGIHTDGAVRGSSGERTSEEIEVRRRVFWAAF
ncbi:hypothetical protein FZEAL_9721, partial [Fusarium zealandicum]